MNKCRWKPSYKNETKKQYIINLKEKHLQWHLFVVVVR